MKKSILAFVLAAAMAAFAEVKIAFVDTADLLKLHPQYENDSRLLKETDREHQAKLERLQDELKDLADEGRKATDEAQNPMLAAKARLDATNKVKDIERRFMTLQQELQREAAKARDDIDALNARLLRTRMAEIREKIEEWAKKNGYDIVLDMTMAAYVDPKFDITDEILKLYGVDPAKRKAAAK